MENQIGKLNIKSIDKTLFIIPFYQRGYRWTKTEVTHLLKDFCEFAENGETEYCLQPLVLQDCEISNDINGDFDKRRRVVDGQQRLTTILLLMKALKIDIPWEIYFEVEKKKLMELLQESFNNANKTINDHFRDEVNNAIKEFLGDEQKKDKLLNLFKDEQKKIVFLEYNLPIDKNDPKGHKAFLRLNDGKTPLTSAELIRALYMVNGNGLNEQEKIEISKEWEIIENTLRDEQFWLMFNACGLEKTPTRIDLLFALVLGINLKEAKANPRNVFEKLDVSDFDLKKVWTAVLRCFWWMQSCYLDNELFNYLCWITEFTDNQASTIYENWRKYPQIDDFKKSVIAIVQEKFKNKIFDKFSYGDGNDELKKLFVLFNVIDCNHSKSKFRFDLYKKESWDIEHIDSQTENDFKNDADKRNWLESAWEELSDQDRRDGQFQNFNSENVQLGNEEFKKCFNAIRGKLSIASDEKITDGDGLGNLTLLNTSINRSYKNAIFSRKRKIIIEEINKGEHFIPPCTQKAFVKFYTKAPSKITYWLKQDFEGYSETLQKWFEEFRNIDTDTRSEELKVAKLEDEFKRDANENATNSINADASDENAQTLNSINNAVSFVKFMNEYVVIVPKIQRQYVQGRTDENGEKCLNGFASTLVNCVAGQDTLSLDFVYGIAVGKTFFPLDGQQRLTTLLLLAWLCGKCKEPNWRFEYEARRATECFIDGLLKSAAPNFDLPENVKCSDEIRKSSWFLKAWEEDSNIAGMLRMLDSLYEKLAQRIKGMGKKDISFEKIKFFVNYLNVKKKSYDQIFLKMNSRGRPLTKWENIKVVLDKYAPTEKKNWQEKLNGTWYEKMWKCLSNIDKVDSKMLLIVELALKVAGYDKNVGDTFELAQWLENEENAKNVFYETSSIYFSALEDISEEMKKALKPSWEKSQRSLRVNFSEDGVKEFYRPLLAFYAATKQPYDEDWMRFAWNVAENDIASKDDFIACCKKLKDYQGKWQKSDSEEKFLNWLARQELPMATAQVKEEIAKAKIIVGKNSEENWKKKIIEAENYAFFKGAIRFLFTDENGAINWDNFDTKFKNAKSHFYFDENWRNEKRVLLIKAMLCKSKKIDDIKDKYFWGNKVENWRAILLDSDLKQQIHSILSSKDLNGFNYSGSDEIIKQLLNNDCIINEDYHENTRVHWYSSSFALYKYRSSPKFLLDWGDNQRNKILNEALNEKRIKLKEGIEIKGGVIYALDIPFIYEEYHFKWQNWNWVDLCDKNFERIENGKYAVNGAEIGSVDDLTHKLSQLISNQNSSNS